MTIENPARRTDAMPLEKRRGRESANRTGVERVLSPARTIDVALSMIFFMILLLCGVFLVLVSKLRRQQAQHMKAKRRRLLCLVPATLETLQVKGVADAILYRDLDGYFDHVYTVHFPALRDRVVQLSLRHTILEFSQYHFSSLRAFPMMNLIASEARYLFSLLRLVKTEEISVIRAQDPYIQGANAFFLSKITGIPFLISVHSNYDLTRRSTGGLAYRFLRSHRIEKAIEKFVFLRADFVIAISDDNRDFAIRNGASPNKAATVRLPTFPIHYDETRAPRNLKSELGLKERKVVLYVGRLSAEKYPDDVVKCARHVADRRDDVVFLFVGDGPMRDDLQRLTNSIGLAEHVQILGFEPQERVRDLMYTADVIVSPLMGRALIEAALSGTPTVAYDVEWHRELIRDHDTGLLVPYRDYAAMAKAILWMLDHPSEAKMLGRHARATAFHQFHPTTLLKQEIACFECVLSGGRIEEAPVPAVNSSRS